MLGTASFTFGLLTAVAAQIPKLDPSKQRSSQANTYVYAANNRTVLSILRGSQARIIVSSQDISPWMKHAIVAAEDRRFYEHRGIDVRGMARALWADISHRFLRRSCVGRLCWRVREVSAQNVELHDDGSCGGR